MLDSVRVRMTVWYVGVLAFLLITLSIGPYLLLRKEVYEKTDLLLKSVCSAMLSLMRQGLGENKLDELASRDAMEALNYPDYCLAIFDDQGHLLAENPAGSSPHMSIQADALRIDGTHDPYTVRASGGGGELRRVVVVRAKLGTAGRSYLVAASRPLAPVLEEADADQRILLIAVPLGLLLAGIGGWFLARKSLAPVLVMSKQAHRIGAENLDERLPVVNPHDELGQLASTFKSLLSRLSSAFSLQRQFMADASHELRTPVSVIRTTTSVTLEKEPRHEEEYRGALVIIDEQVRRLTRIVEDMFRLARADAGSLTLQQRPFYLDELLAEVVRAASVLGAPKEIIVKLPPLAESLCYGDEYLLRQMISNLLDNAVKFTPRGGAVTLDVGRKNGSYMVSVTDTGPGIPREAQARVFERFFRLEKTNSTVGGANNTGAGAGLGLSIARSIAEAHGGSLSLQRSDSNGSTFVAVLPVKPSTFETKTKSAQ
jgi:heavy metal sensor kinase